jgi:hypothetical protein
MQSFDRYFKKKMENSGFKTLYEAECNVCANTMEIFQKAEIEHISMNCLASEVDTDPEKIDALRDADHCDPYLVIRLCRHLGLREPENCPKLNDK